ncbi:MAG: ankyrin repeat domain-containing protein [Candidatus Anstonellales archaeon]
MEVKDKDKKKFGSKGGKKEAAGEGMKEERRLSEEEVFRRVLEAVRSGREDKEAFEELRRINRERKGEDKRRAERLGEELINECKRIIFVFSEKMVNLERIVKLVLEGADVNLQDNFYGRTALIQAVWNDVQEKIVKMLIKAGADVNVQDNKGWTALMWAADGNQKGVLNLLIENGANLFLKNNEGKTAMDLAGDEKTKSFLKGLVDNMDEGVKKRMEREAELRFGLKECNKEKAKGLILELLGS